MKGRHDVVTAMDREVERFIRARDREALSAGRGHRRGGGRRRRRPPVAHRSDRRHRELRARVAALLRVDRLPRARRADAGRDLRSQHDWLYAAARGEGAWRDGERMRGEPIADMQRGHGRMRLVDAAAGVGVRRSRRRACSTAGGAIRRAGSGALGLADVAAGRGRGLRRAAHQRLGLRRRHRARARRRAASPTISSRATDCAAGNPLIATNAALCGKLAAVIGIPTTR